jgi:uncharacterized protein YnzC (UPF0291/DUF896 family)
MEKLIKTLEQMDVVFSSNEFAKQAKKNGLTQREIEMGSVRNFLIQHAHRKDSKRMWEKKFRSYVQPIISDAITESDAIELLKSKGYKVMKPVSEWIEI